MKINCPKHGKTSGIFIGEHDFVCWDCFDESICPRIGISLEDARRYRELKDELLEKITKASHISMGCHVSDPQCPYRIKDD
jgi:hypothetical protein